MAGERLGDVESIASCQRRARSDAVGRGIMPAEPQEGIGERFVATCRIKRGRTVDRHPGAPIVDDGPVLVEQDAANGHGSPDGFATRNGAFGYPQATHTAPCWGPAWMLRSWMVGARPDSGLTGSQVTLISLKRALRAS